MPGMTLTEKILAAHAGKERVAPGEFVMAKVDLVLGNDVTAPIAIREFESVGVETVFAKDRIALVQSHYVPNKDIKSAEQAKVMREFARKHEIELFWEVGRAGVDHAILPQEGLVVPGDVVVGADSHTCTYGALGCFSTGVGSTDLAAAMATGECWLMVPKTLRFVLTGKRKPYVSGKDIILYIIGMVGVDGALYRSMEYTGSAVGDLEMHDRFTITNMAIEAGGKNGIFAPDTITRAYCEGRAKREPVCFAADADAEYEKVYDIDVGQIGLQVAFPHLPENSKPVGEARGIRIDQVFIGSCTNGWIEDLRVAADILRGRQVHRDVRAIVIPPTREIYQQALREGLLEVFVEAGAAVGPPTCGPCLGGHMGVLAAGEKAVATSNRNFVGRMGHKDSAVYLAGPAVAAASAVAGEIVSPEDL